jgi:hypothetical protein
MLMHLLLWSRLIMIHLRFSGAISSSAVPSTRRLTRRLTQLLLLFGLLLL